jgi:hypothetical protein
MKRKEGEKEGKEKVHAAKYPGISTSNRFLMLAEKGKAARDKSLSAKRFRSESEYTETGEDTDVCEQDDTVFANMEKTENQLKEAKTVIDQVKAEVDKIPDPGPLKSVMEGMVKWMVLTTSIQENTASVMLDGFAKANKKAAATKQVAPVMDPPGGGGAKVSGKQDGGTEEDSRRKRFVQAVREAEKSTLVFNTDMGTVAVMNPNTMNRKFSMALKAKAAEVDGNVNGEPKADTVTQLDDTLSMVKNMDYFGKTTKQAKARSSTPYR